MLRWSQVPLPYRRHFGTEVTFDEGPTSWARLWIGKEELSNGESQFELVLAFDTRITDAADGYTMLRTVDLS